MHGCHWNNRLHPNHIFYPSARSDSKHQGFRIIDHNNTWYRLTYVQLSAALLGTFDAANTAGAPGINGSGTLSDEERIQQLVQIASALKALIASVSGCSMSECVGLFTNLSVYYSLEMCWCGSKVNSFVLLFVYLLFKGDTKVIGSLYSTWQLSQTSSSTKSKAATMPLVRQIIIC